eukprot:7393100-Lingulodinium_polyedra.AAC.1
MPLVDDGTLTTAARQSRRRVWQNAVQCHHPTEAQSMASANSTKTCRCSRPCIFDLKVDPSWQSTP